MNKVYISPEVTLYELETEELLNEASLQLLNAEEEKDSDKARFRGFSSFEEDFNEY